MRGNTRAIVHMLSRQQIRPRTAPPGNTLIRNTQPKDPSLPSACPRPGRTYSASAAQIMSPPQTPAGYAATSLQLEWAFMMDRSFCVFALVRCRIRRKRKPARRPASPRPS